MSNLPTESQNHNNNQGQKDYITLNIYQNNNQRNLYPVINQTEANLKLNDNHLIQNKNEFGQLRANNNFAYLDNTRENQNPNFISQQKFSGNAEKINQAQKDTNSIISNIKKKKEMEKEAEEERKRRSRNKRDTIISCIAISIFLPIIGCLLGILILRDGYKRGFRDREYSLSD
jgi:hypothetical protein